MHIAFLQQHNQLLRFCNIFARWRIAIAIVDKPRAIVRGKNCAAYVPVEATPVKTVKMIIMMTHPSLRLLRSLNCE